MILQHFVTSPPLPATGWVRQTQAHGMDFYFFFQPTPNSADSAAHVISVASLSATLGNKEMS